MKLYKKSLFIISIAACIVLSPVLSFNQVQAATTGIKPMQNNKTYKSHDLNGDKRKDSIQLKTSKSGYQLVASFYVNGKKVYTLPKDDCEFVGYSIITLKNGKHFIYAFTQGADAGISQYMILQYKGNKMSKVVNFTTLMKAYQGASYINNWSSPNSITVSGNNIKVVFTSMNWTIGAKNFIFTYKYSGGTLKRASYGGNIVSYTKDPYIAAKKFAVYRKVGTSAKAFTVSKGQKVKVGKYYLKNGKLWLQVKNSSGKTGWIKSLTYKAAKGYGRSPLFTNAYYAN